MYRYPKFVIDLLTLLVLALAVAGATRLLVVEKITQVYRDQVQVTFGDKSLITYGVNCVFCTGFHMAWMLTWTTFVHAGEPLWMGFLTALAVYAVAPHLADR